MLACMGNKDRGKKEAKKAPKPKPKPEPSKREFSRLRRQSRRRPVRRFIERLHGRCGGVSASPVWVDALSLIASCGYSATRSIGGPRVDRLANYSGIVAVGVALCRTGMYESRIDKDVANTRYIASLIDWITLRVSLYLPRSSTTPGAIRSWSAQADRLTDYWPRLRRSSMYFVA